MNNKYHFLFFVTNLKNKTPKRIDYQLKRHQTKAISPQAISLFILSTYYYFYSSVYQITATSLLTSFSP